MFVVKFAYELNGGDIGKFVTAADKYDRDTQTIIKRVFLGVKQSPSLDDPPLTLILQDEGYTKASSTVIIYEIRSEPDAIVVVE